MPQELPKLGDLFFAVCRTAIKNTAWKYSEFERVKFVEGQLDALQEYFQQPAESGNVEISLNPNPLPEPTTPEISKIQGQGEAKAPEVDKDVISEPEALKTAPVASEQEKKNS